MGQTFRPRVESTLKAIGDTPLVQLQRVVPAGYAAVFVKLEYYNPTGSYKDRMALAMVEEAERRGALRPGMTLVEYTGGSTGSSLAFVCAVKGYRLKIVSSDAFAPEKIKTMRAFGAEVELIPSTGGKVTPDLIPRMKERVQAIVREEGAYPTDQLNNADMLKGYEQMGREVVEQMAGPIDGFCGGVGTAGMVMGVARAVRAANAAARIRVLEPATAAPISTGKSGAHGVEGISVVPAPPLLDKSLYDDARPVEEAEGRAMARRLAREEGIFAGTSSGLNVAGAIALARELGPGRRVVTVAVDSGLKYLAGALYEV